MPTVRDVFNELDELAPYSLTEKWDHCGLQIGSADWEVKGCILALDVTSEVIALTEQRGANLIITHHPVIFHPLSAIRGDDRINRLIEGKIASLSAHTNLDLAEGGVNDALSEALCLSDSSPFMNEDRLGKIGFLPQAMTAGELASYLKEKLCAGAVQYTGETSKESLTSPETQRKIRKVAIVSGTGGDFITAAKDEGAEALITGEAKHSDLIDAINLGIPLFAAGHHDTEKVILEPLREKLAKRFPEIIFTVYQELLVCTLS